MDMTQAKQQNDEATQTINEILQHKYENKMHCPYFYTTTAVCTLKTQKYKPCVYWLDSNSKGTRSSRFYVINKYHGTMGCDLIFNSGKQSYFDCVIMQDFKPHQCILEKDLKQALNIISQEVFDEYGVTPKQIPLEKVSKTIRRIKTSVTKEMMIEFQRWIEMHYKVVKKDEGSYIIVHV